MLGKGLLPRIIHFKRLPHAQVNRAQIVHQGAVFRQISIMNAFDQQLLKVQAFGHKRVQGIQRQCRPVHQPHAIIGRNAIEIVQHVD